MTDIRDLYKLVAELDQERDDTVNLYDSVDIELNEGFVIETGVVGFTKDGIVLEADESTLEFLDLNDILIEETDSLINENKSFQLNESHVSKFDSLEDLAKAYPKDMHDYIQGGSGSPDFEQELYAIAYDNGIGGRGPVRYWEPRPEQVLNWVMGELGPDFHPTDHGDQIDEAPGAETLAHNQGTEEENLKAFGLAESDSGDDIFTPAGRSVANRIIRNHPELLAKHGLEKVINAIQNVTDHIHDLEEIGTSDVGHWMNSVYLGLGEPSIFKDDLDANQKRVGQLGPTEKVKNNNIGKLVGGEGADPLLKIKHLALGDNAELDEGLKGWLAGAALLATLWGVEVHQAKKAVEASPQIQKLIQLHQRAEREGDPAKIKELEDRLETAKDHFLITGREIMNKKGEPVDPTYEAKYQGREVPLGKPMQGDVKKSKVYVRKPNGKVVKVNFGDKTMRIKKNSPSHRKSFRARHHCENPGPRWKARYWSCRAW
jgi:hypothetical protein